MAHSGKFDESTPLPLLIAEARRLDELSRAYLHNALRIWLELGRVLTLAKSLVGNRKWKERRQEYLPDLNRSTDTICRRLAAHSARIEQELETKPNLSINSALALIPTKPKAPKPPKPVTLEKWGALSAEDKKAGIAHDIARHGIESFLNYLSPSRRQELADRLPAPISGRPEVYNEKAYELVCQALALLHNKSSSNIDGMRAKLTSAAAHLKPSVNKKTTVAVSAATLSTIHLDRDTLSKALGLDPAERDAVPVGATIN